MTRIAIVEDEAAVREQLAGYVQRYTRQYGTPFEVTEFADGMEILEDYRPQFDIIFLDVEMKHLDAGCTLSSAIACGLAQNLSLVDAVEAAKRYLTGALEAQLDLGQGSGPLDHMWRYRQGYC